MHGYVLFTSTKKFSLLQLIRGFWIKPQKCRATIAGHPVPLIKGGPMCLRSVLAIQLYTLIPKRNVSESFSKRFRNRRYRRCANVYQNMIATGEHVKSTWGNILQPPGTHFLLKCRTKCARNLIIGLKFALPYQRILRGNLCKSTPRGSKNQTLGRPPPP